MTEYEKLIKRIEDYRDGHCVVHLDALLAEGGNPLVYKGRIDSCNQIIAALRRTAEDERLEREGLLVRLPCKVGDEVQAIVRRPNNRNFALLMGTVSDIKTVVRVTYDGGRFVDFLASDLDKTVFLTRQEAEAALGGGEV